MADYQLNNTGQEIQERLDQVPINEQAIADEVARATEAEGALSGDVSTLQATVEADVENLAENYYNKQEVEGLIIPHDAPIVVGPLPAEGESGKIYRVPGTSTYSDYAWNGTEFVLLATHNIDAIWPQIGYYTCSTAAGTAEKVVTASGYILATGGNIRIKMTEANTADAVTLNINGTGAKTLYYDGEQASSTNAWEANEIISVFYDGTRFMASNSQSGGGAAEKISYDNLQSGLAATNVQEGIDELSQNVEEISNIALTYNNAKDNKVIEYTLSDISWTIGKNINANSSDSNFGGLGSVTWERASGKVDCTNATTVEIRIFTDNQSSRGFVFYDVNDTPLVGYIFATKNSIIYSNVSYPVPSNASYFRTTYINNDNTFFARVIQNNPLGIYVEDGTDSDAAVSDANENKILKVVGGHVFTKNFSSFDINEYVELFNGRYGCGVYKRNQLYTLDFSDTSDIDFNSWTINENGYITNGSTFDSSNTLTIGRTFAMTGNYLICDFMIAEGGVAYIGCGNTLCKVDFANSVFAIFGENSSTTISASESISLDGYQSTKLRVILKCNINWNVEASLVNLKSGATIATIANGSGRGRLKGSPKFYSTTSEMKIYDIRVGTVLGERNRCWMYATGDSITEGYRMTESDNYIHRYGSLLSDGLVKCSGNSGCKISDVIGRLKSEAAIIKPVYTMVMIGTNGGNTEVNLKQMINIILSYGSIPIINHVPAISNGSVATSVNNTIDAVVSEFRNKGVHILSCKMNIAVATDNDETKTEASALTIDGVHPNAQGHLAMFNRMKVDAPELFNF